MNVFDMFMNLKFLGDKNFNLTLKLRYETVHIPILRLKVLYMLFTTEIQTFVTSAKHDVNVSFV